uniref:Uncharacterized protein n=1 Tax=Colobus angolensis palliatus TaxID=336983 RepID=A0A2K5JSU9_COLAP
MKVSPSPAALPRLAPKMEWVCSPRLALPPHRHLPCPSHSSHGHMGPHLPSCSTHTRGGSWSVFLVVAKWRADMAFSVSRWGGDLHGGDKALMAALGSSLRLKDAMRSLASPHVKGGMARDLHCSYSTVVLIPPHLPLLPARAPVV